MRGRKLPGFQLIDKGQLDDKILAVPHNDPLFKEYHTLEDVPPHFLEEMGHFFSVYKDLESAEVVGRGWEGLKHAYTEIERAVERYLEHVRDGH